MEEIFEPAYSPNLFYNSKKLTGMVGLENLGTTSYLKALVQMLYHISAFRKAVYMLPHDNELLDTSTTLALQNIFRNLQSRNRYVSTSDLTRSFGWTTTDAHLQQDVQEMMRVLLDILETKMKGSSVEGFIGDLFAGNFSSYIRCVDVEYESVRKEEFYDIQLDVKDCSNIYESFRKYTKKELLTGENKYYAGPEFKKQIAEKYVSFTKFPPVLTIHLKRFDFSLQRMSSTKINDKFEFPARLCLDEFLSADAPPESRASPNIYLLHSVLVHKGDDSDVYLNILQC
jgi:ubiquitin carboxyl-terminal hydrolase 7